MINKYVYLIISIFFLNIVCIHASMHMHYDAVRDKTAMANNKNNQPKILITAITNRTSYDLMLLDRNQPSVRINLPAYSTKELVNYEVKNHENVKINGSMLDCMKLQAQFAVVQVDKSGKLIEENGVLFNLNVMPSGYNDGTGFIIGAPGFTRFTFMQADFQKGCSMIAYQLKNAVCKAVKINIEISLDDLNLSSKKIQIDCHCSVIEEE